MNRLLEIVEQRVADVRDLLMNRNNLTAWKLAALGAALTVSRPTDAAQYRIYYQGSEAVAVQSSGGPVNGTTVIPAPPVTTAPVVVPATGRPAGYSGLPPAPSGSVITPVSVPAVAAPVVAAPVVPAPVVPAGRAPTLQRSADNFGAGTPNQIVTFLHPYTNQAVTVPLTLPAGRPTVVTRSDRIIYDYGLFAQKVVVKFVSNGGVEVRYRD